MKNTNLIQALNTLLIQAKCKLQNAIDKNKEWDIKHYKSDIDFIESELLIVKTKTINN